MNKILLSHVEIKNLADVLQDASTRFSAKTAVIENGRHISYHELWNDVDILSASFNDIGIKKSRRVALIVPNSYDFIRCFFAILKINAIVTPLSHELTTFELTGILNNLNPYAIIAGAAFIEKVYLENSMLLNNKLLVFQDKLSSSLTLANTYELKTLSEFGTKLDGENRRTGDEHFASINYTYRGYGYPLGAILSHDNYIQAAMFYIKRTALVEQHRVLLMLPSYHVFPLMGGIISPLLVGATVVVTKNIIISHVFEMIKKYQITMLLAVPTLYRFMIDYNRNLADMSTVKCCITGGDGMSADMQEEFRAKFNIEVLQGYGLTECLPVTCNPLRGNKVGSLGPPGRSDVKIKIVDESGNELNSGEIGEIIVKSPTVMCGYYRLGEVTRNVLKDGWLYTGDHGYLDFEGYLYMTGRKKKILKVGGKVVDIKEVKDVLLSHPLISDVAVYSEEDSLWGATLGVEICPFEHQELKERDVRIFCSKRLSRYKIPKKINIVSRVLQK